MAADDGDQKLFFKLINKQRSTTQQAGAILRDGKLITDEDDIRGAWKEYFYKLGKPEILLRLMKNTLSWSKLTLST
jgi:hypothetical protein